MSLSKGLLPRYTYEDYKNWQGDWELVEGIPFALASPTVKRQRVLAKLVRYLDEALENCPDCEVLPDTDYIVDQHTVLRPDVAEVCDNRGEKITATSHAVFEIVSPYPPKMDETTKEGIYEKESIPLYVLVYPNLRKVRIFKLSPKGVYKKTVDLSGGVFSFDPKGRLISLDFDKILGEV